VGGCNIHLGGDKFEVSCRDEKKNKRTDSFENKSEQGCIGACLEKVGKKPSKRKDKFGLTQKRERPQQRAEGG